MDEWALQVERFGAHALERLGWLLLAGFVGWAVGGLALVIRYRLWT